MKLDVYNLIGVYLSCFMRYIKKLSVIEQFMKKLFVTLLMSFNVCFGQNLVPNQSFELTGVIPCDWSQSSIQFNNSTVDWNSPTLGTPDIYSTTINSNCPNFQPNSDYPLCFNGTQLPHSGNTFAGIYINDNQ